MAWWRAARPGLFVAVALGWPSIAHAGDEAFLQALTSKLPSAEAATEAAAGGTGGPDAVQRQYDLARDLQEALLVAAPVSRACKPAWSAALGLARGQVMEAEGYDRRSATIANRGRELQARSRARLTEVRVRCRIGSPSATRIIPSLVSPLSGEAFFGRIVAAAPRSASSADLYVGDRLWARMIVAERRVSFDLATAPGSYTLTVRFRRGERQVGLARAHDVWLLPGSSQGARRAGMRDARLDTELRRIVQGFSGFSGIWLHDLSTGKVAGWKENDRFPAASTVKLGVLLVGLSKYPRPRASSIGYDLAQMIRWSSNLATNRLLVKLGGGSEVRGAALAEQALMRLGAGSSTFTGPYIPGTRPSFATASTGLGAPPLVSSRTTTARDLGRVLWSIQAATAGDRNALATTRLSLHQARVGLGWLLASQPTGDNGGLFRPYVRSPMAQKHGWISSARHTAAIIYTPTGPVIAVVLTFQEGLTRSTASALAKRVLVSAGLTG